MHKNPDLKIDDSQWDNFFKSATEFKIFKGGSAMTNSKMYGLDNGNSVADKIGGFMRFDAEDSDQLSVLMSKHPVVIAGGSVEIFEMPVA